MPAAYLQAKEARSIAVVHTYFQVAIAVKPAQFIPLPHILVVAADLPHLFHQHELQREPSGPAQRFKPLPGHIGYHVLVLVYVYHIAFCYAACNARLIDLSGFQCVFRQSRLCRFLVLVQHGYGAPCGMQPRYIIILPGQLQAQPRPLGQCPQGRWQQAVIGAQKVLPLMFAQYHPRSGVRKQVEDQQVDCALRKMLIHPAQQVGSLRVVKWLHLVAYIHHGCTRNMLHQHPPGNSHRGIAQAKIG